mmetsp:Transcript_26369/g.61346  ORF Transcript_26369/g.61346 Transcript_26369/m.61346 type:complete len:114 (+) Transcript_26369:675-1016(+)
MRVLAKVDRKSPMFRMCSVHSVGNYTTGSITALEISKSSGAGFSLLKVPKNHFQSRKTATNTSPTVVQNRSSTCNLFVDVLVAKGHCEQDFGIKPNETLLRIDHAVHNNFLTR